VKTDVIVRPVRYKWERRDKNNKTCTVCGSGRCCVQVPHRARWFTEWRLPDGSYVDNYWGGSTPPCEPPTVTAAEAVAR